VYRFIFGNETLIPLLLDLLRLGGKSLCPEFEFFAAISPFSPLPPPSLPSLSRYTQNNINFDL
jgi:hypothetical protein